MSGSAIRWCVLGALWAAFTFWYTSFSGPLTEAEIEDYRSRLEAAGRGGEQMEDFLRFMREDDGGHFVMVNVIDNAPVGAEENLARYMAHMWPALLSRACHPIFAGSAIAEAMDLSGIQQADGGPGVWDTGALMRYRSRRDLLDIATDPSFEEPHEYKMLGMTKTIAFPVKPLIHFGDPRFLLAMLGSLLGLLADRVLRRA